MSIYKYIFTFLSLLLLSSCIGDDFVEDFVEPELRITSAVDSIALNTSYQFELIFLNNTGQEEEISSSWSSSNDEIITITNDGLATALSAGEAIISVIYNDGTTDYVDSRSVVVGENTTESITSIEGVIKTTSSYTLTGDFIFEETDSGVKLSLGENYSASTALPGLYVYLSNNDRSVADALEIGAVEVFNGAHSYEIEDVGLQDYKYILYFCKPFNVKVGDGSL